MEDDCFDLLRPAVGDADAGACVDLFAVGGSVRSRQLSCLGSTLGLGNYRQGRDGSFCEKNKAPAQKGKIAMQIGQVREGGREGRARDREWG